jgi:hypothetical protein
MILPLRVFGSASVNRISSGEEGFIEFAKGQIELEKF